MRWIDSKRAAEILGVGKWNLYRLCQNKKVPHWRIGGKVCFDEAELKAWLDKQHVQPKAA